ncbi:MAG: SprB repeat-containing protein, partial [Bacteroidota bacterium]
MKRLIILAVFVSLSIHVALAQQKRWVRSVEYFWGQTDPGPGQGIAVLPADGQFDASLEQFFKNGITTPDTGLNLFNIRVKDQSGSWGPVFRSVVQAGSVPSSQPTPIRIFVSAEYFWNNDPGAGNGIPVLATDGQFDESLEQFFANGLTVPQPGKNLFCMRTKDQHGQWGPVFKTVVLAPESPQPIAQPLRMLVAAEYFWGTTDPGTGNGSPVLATDGQFDASLEQLYANGLLAPQPGQNLFNIRVKDQAGQWGPLFKSVVIVPSTAIPIGPTQRLIIAAEYFWGTSDPGAGSGTPVLASDGDFNTSLEQLHGSNLHAPAGGNNLFNIRVKDQSGNWGPIFKSVVVVDTVLPVPSPPKRFMVAAEYFWGTNDPGAGNGSPVLATDGNFDQALEQLHASGLLAPSTGENLFNIRVKDQSGNWGPVFKSVVYVSHTAPTPVFPKRLIIAGEYFWGLQDPGAGNGFVLLATDGDFNSSIEQFFKSGFTAPAGGLNLFNARLKDQNGNWGPLFKTVVNVLFAADLQITASHDSVVCYGDSAHVTITATGGVSPYSGTGVFTVPAGTHVFRVNDAKGDTATTSFPVVEPDPLITIVNASSISCPGDSSTVLINTDGGTAPYTGTGAYRVTAGQYRYIITDANGCRDTAAITISAPAPIQLSSTSTPILCNGDSSLITVTATGGTLPYDTISEFLLPAGTHQLIITDANECPATANITVGQPSALISASTAGAIICAGDLSTVTVTASGGTTPYFGTGTVEVPAGLYTYLITDANGCQLVDSIYISQPPPVVATATLSNPISCYGGTGVVNVAATGGTAPYFGTGPQTVAEGSWTFAVTDANGCSSMSPSVEVIAPSKITVSYTVVPATCSLANGSITLSVNGGTPPYSYGWSGGQTTSAVSSLLPGTYTATITDAN